MGLNLKKRNRNIKIVLSSFIFVLALVLTFSFRSNAHGATYTPSVPSSNPFLFSYTGSDYNITVMPMVNQVIAVNTLGNKTKPILSNSTLTFDELYIGGSNNQRVNYVTSRARFESIDLKKIYNLNYYSSSSVNYYGSYFSSKWLYYEQDDYDPINNSSIFNHIRMNIYSNNQSFYVNDFNGHAPDDVSNFDFNLYLMVLIKNEMLYTNVTGTLQSSSFTDTYPNNAFGINSDGVIKTNIPFAEFDGQVCDFTDYLKNGLTIDYYFKNWLGYSQYNNLVGVLTNFYMTEYDGDDPNIYISTYLDYLPITFNWDATEYQDGYNAGYNAGVSDGSSTGYNNGYNDGVSSVDTTQYYDNGYDSGYSAGVNSVNTEAIRQNAYSDGYNAGLLNSSHDYGIKDLLYSIVDIPINVFSNLFSFTIFGTRVWAIITSLLAILVLLWLVGAVFGVIFKGGGHK